MKTIRIGINGMGRIGRTLTRALVNRHLQNQDLNLQLVAFNNLGHTDMTLHLLKYDSLHGKFPTRICADANNLIVNEGQTKLVGFSHRNPQEIDWSSQEVDVVIDATGVFKDKKGLSQHIGGSVKKVIMCAPGKDLDGTFVMGINHENYDTHKHHVISNASCTTNCLAPVAKVLNDNFQIESGFMTTVHAYTSDQNILDANHSDLRRARAAAMSMIPTSTGAAKALGEVIPSLKGKLDGFAVRVPTPNVSMVDLTANLSKQVRIQDVNKVMQEASLGALKGILGYTEQELVSQDYLGATESSFFDAPMTNVIDKTVKVVSWYDNEVGFSNRVLDLANYIGQKL